MRSGKRYMLGEEALRQIREVIREYAHRYWNDRPDKGRWTQQQESHYVVLDGTLSPATAGAALTTPSTATASVYYCDSSGDLVDSGRNITVTNYFEHIEVLSGTLAIATWTAGHWRLTSADCEPLT
jgi:hypothetical protein